MNCTPELYRWNASKLSNTLKEKEKKFLEVLGRQKTLMQAMCKTYKNHLHLQSQSKTYIHNRKMN